MGTQQREQHGNARAIDIQRLNTVGLEQMQMYTLVPDVVYHVSKVSMTLAIARKIYKLFFTYHTWTWRSPMVSFSSINVLNAIT